MEKFILASSSPRRSEILRNLNVDFISIKNNISENLNRNLDPVTYAMILSFLKAEDVAINQKGLVIGADTVVSINNEILGKPKNKEDAFEMLSKLSGNKHKVITGVSLINVEKNIRVVDYEESYVYFRKLGNEEILKYIETKEPYGKAGSYAIQGFGSLLVDKIEGCYFNIVGLPVSKLNFLLKKYYNYSIL